MALPAVTVFGSKADDQKPFNKSRTLALITDIFVATVLLGCAAVVIAHMHGLLPGSFNQLALLNSIGPKVAYALAAGAAVWAALDAGLTIKLLCAHNGKNSDAPSTGSMSAPSSDPSLSGGGSGSVHSPVHSLDTSAHDDSSTSEDPISGDGDLSPPFVPESSDPSLSVSGLSGATIPSSVAEPVDVPVVDPADVTLVAPAPQSLNPAMIVDLSEKTGRAKSDIKALLGAFLDNPENMQYPAGENGLEDSEYGITASTLMLASTLEPFQDDSLGKYLLGWCEYIVQGDPTTKQERSEEAKAAVQALRDEVCVRDEGASAAAADGRDNRAGHEAYIRATQAADAAATAAAAETARMRYGRGDETYSLENLNHFATPEGAVARGQFNTALQSTSVYDNDPATTVANLNQLIDDVKGRTGDIDALVTCLDAIFGANISGLSAAECFETA